MHTRLLYFSIALLLLVAIGFTLATLPLLSRAATPLLETKSRTVGLAIANTIGKLVTAGVPLHRFAGMVSYMDELRAHNTEISYLAVRDTQGNLLYESGKATGEKTSGYMVLSVFAPGKKLVAKVLVEQDPRYIQTKLRDVMLDALTVLLIGTIIAIELMLFINTTLLAAPLDAVDRVLTRASAGDFRYRINTAGKLGEVGALGKWLNDHLLEINARFQSSLDRSGSSDATVSPLTLARYRFCEAGSITESGDQLAIFRWPFFLLVFAEALSVSFLPRFVSSFPLPDIGIPRDILVGSPISVFMLTWAIALPFAGTWSDGVGRRASLAAGAGMTAFGLMLCFLANSLVFFLLCRAIVAIGYALVFVSAQSYVTDHCPPERRTQGMSMFLTSFFGGSLSGAAIGGILADHLGWKATFGLSAFLASSVIFFVLRFLPNAQANETRKAGWAEFKAVLGNKSIMSLTLFAAIPSKISLTGLLYFAMPLYLLQYGASQAMGGRVMMAYGMAIILLAPWFSRLADRWKNKLGFVVAGGILAGAGLFICAFLPSGWETALIGVASIGLGFAISGAPQLSMVSQFAQHQGDVSPGLANGVFRLVERIGSALGPMVAGLLLALYGFGGVFVGIGLLNLFGVLMLAAIHSRLSGAKQP